MFRACHECMWQQRWIWTHLELKQKHYRKLRQKKLTLLTRFALRLLGAYRTPTQRGFMEEEISFQPLNFSSAQ